MISTSTVRTALTVIYYGQVQSRESLTTGDNCLEFESTSQSNEGQLQAVCSRPGLAGGFAGDLEPDHRARKTADRLRRDASRPGPRDDARRRKSIAQPAVRPI